MPSALTIGAVVVLAFGAIFQVYLAPIAFDTYGVGRVVQPISDFPYTCRKIEHPLLQACEDLRLDESGRRLYLACSTSEGRTAWTPAVHRRNASGRTGQDSFVVLDIDHPGAKKDFSPTQLKLKGYKGAIKDSEIDLHGFDIEPVTSVEQTLRFFVVNHRPPVDAKRKPLDAHTFGANSTVEVFELERGTTELKHKRTYFNWDVIKTPNRVAATGEGGFLMTNDAGNRSDWIRQIEPLYPRGSLALCGLRQCSLVTPENMVMPNGLTKNPVDGLYYVPSSLDGSVRVFRLEPPGFGTGTEARQLREVAVVRTKIPIDNLDADADGNIWAAAFPKVGELIASFDTPRTARVPVTALKITRIQPTKDQEGKEVFHYDVTKALEDRDAEMVSGVTSVVHDAKTGRLFFGGVFTPWVTVCEKK